MLEALKEGPEVVDNSFYNERTPQSQVKAAIVSEYFEIWAKIMIATRKKTNRGQNDRIAYIDLFAGKGEYEDGSPSTPLLILQKAINDKDIRDRLITILMIRTRSTASHSGKRSAEAQALKASNIHQRCKHMK